MAFISEKSFGVHPVSEKLLKEGHPWITVDEFSKKFETAGSPFIRVHDKKQSPIGICINDPSHEQIKARLWCQTKDSKFNKKKFLAQLKHRVEAAIAHRGKITDRNNIYLVFSEADDLPGLYIQKLNDHILIQYHSDFWVGFQEDLIKLLKVNSVNLTDDKIWIQKRAQSYNEQSPAVCLNREIEEKSVIITEFGVQYEVVLGKYYDTGIYTDMSAIRSDLYSEIGQVESTLNLFSYTGAYSLLALSKGSEVDSIDLSKDYMGWLERNIELNSQLDLSMHFAHVGDISRKLNQLNKGFDLIICDPPSSFTNGKKRTTALRFYEAELKRLSEKLNDHGYIVCFLNTHRTTTKKFNQTLDKVIKKNDLKLNRVKSFKLQDDCPTLAKFEEGNYLKGILFQKT